MVFKNWRKYLNFEACKGGVVFEKFGWHVEHAKKDKEKEWSKHSQRLFVQKNEGVEKKENKRFFMDSDQHFEARRFSGWLSKSSENGSLSVSWSNLISI